MAEQQLELEAMLFFEFGISSIQCCGNVCFAVLIRNLVVH